MSPQSHNRLLVAASVIAFLGGAVVGFWIGAQFGGPLWRVGGLVVGILIAEIAARAAIIHLVPIRCPDCAGRMWCRTRQLGGTSVAEYTCRRCDQTLCPSLDFSKRLLGGLLDRLSGRNRR